jgi:predicted cupin superfamily sugar epimerase
MPSKMSFHSARDLIRHFELQPHPEGGYFRQTYKSQGAIAHNALPAAYDGGRAYATMIYYLLPKGAKSHLHRLHSDEMWHFYLGGPMHVAQIHADGREETVTLGQDIVRGEQLQSVVPAGTWFGAYPAEGTEYSFVGCTVAPGFEFADFELAEREALLRQYPHARRIIELLTRD